MKTTKLFLFLPLCVALLFSGCDKDDSPPSLKNLKAGMLEEIVVLQGMEDVTSLTLGGKIDQRDFDYMKEMMVEGNLSEINLKNAMIVAYGEYPAGEIPKEAFMLMRQVLDNTYLKKFVFPERVTSIGSYAFYYCIDLTGSLIIPDRVTSIGFCAFSDCFGLTGSLVIPNSVTSIKSHAFMGCSGFTGSLTIPTGVTSIESNTFFGCSGFTGVLTIPTNITSIGHHAFTGCSGFTGSLIIPNSVTSIGAGAFAGCSGFTGSLIIPASVTSIESEAFYNCSGFTGSLIIPASVTSIRSNAFDGCKNLSDIKVSWAMPIFYPQNMFPPDKTIYVPSASLSSYQSASGWKDHTLIGY